MVRLAFFPCLDFAALKLFVILNDELLLFDFFLLPFLWFWGLRPFFLSTQNISVRVAMDNINSLSLNEIVDDGAKEIAKALKTNTTLQSLK